MTAEIIGGYIGLNMLDHIRANP